MTKQQLIEDNMGLVHYIINKYYPSFSYDEDISQCGMVGLCNAVRLWDESKGAFTTYASHCIRNEINREFRRRNKHKGVLSLDYEYNDNDNEVTTFKEIIPGEDGVDYIDYTPFYDQLTESQKLIFEYKINGCNQPEIAKKMGISKQRVNQQLRIIKIKWNMVFGDGR
jgi:RNA polymerase sporulation-specific sigma factor